ncbi:MAG: metalloregulator ArsR/SmtB family transcription factor [Actinomycetota bacterium]|nr:metalloregulator ArsR/SmtB family transcription factor [Actinomycetota bacterium]
MPVDVFTVLAEPRRRQILDTLRDGPASVGELVGRLAVSQPTISKHLRVLRQSGLVRSRTSAQQRIYSIEYAPLQELDRWLRPYQVQWTRSFGALALHLDARHTVRSGRRRSTGHPDPTTKETP